MSFEIDHDGDLLWTNENGDWHREKGPAIIKINGIIEYRVNNLCHRLDGAAVIYPDGYKYYLIHGTYYTKEGYLTKVRAKVKKL